MGNTEIVQRFYKFLSQIGPCESIDIQELEDLAYDDKVGAYDQ